MGFNSGFKGLINRKGQLWFDLTTFLPGYAFPSISPAKISRLFLSYFFCLAAPHRKHVDILCSAVHVCGQCSVSVFLQYNADATCCAPPSGWKQSNRLWRHSERCVALDRKHTAPINRTIVLIRCFTDWPRPSLIHTTRPKTDHAVH
jgi:hypothetical protein